MSLFETRLVKFKLC